MPYSLIRKRYEGGLEREVAKQGTLSFENANVWNKPLARSSYETTGFLHDRERERERYMYSTPTGVQSDNLDCLRQALSRSSRIRSVRPYVSMQRPSTSILKICCFDAHGSIWKSLSKDGGTWSSWGMNARFIACYTYSNSCLLIWSLLSCCILTYLDRCCKVDQRKYYVHVGPARVLPQIVLVAFAGSWRSWQITAFCRFFPAGSATASAELKSWWSAVIQVFVTMHLEPHVFTVFLTAALLPATHRHPKNPTP